MMEAPISDALVFFGITGDLAFKKIFPALQAMVRHRGGTDGSFAGVIGVASARWTLESVRARMRDSLAASRGGVDEVAYRVLSERMRYVGGDYRETGLLPAAIPQTAHAVSEAGGWCLSG